MIQRHLVYLGILICVLSRPFTAHAQDSTQGTACTGTVAAENQRQHNGC